MGGEGRQLCILPAIESTRSGGCLEEKVQKPQKGSGDGGEEGKQDLPYPRVRILHFSW